MKEIHASLFGGNLFHLRETSTSIICFLFCYLCATCRSSHPSLIHHLIFSYLENSPRLYQTSISPLRVRTSMMVWPRKSSLSRLNLCFTRDLMSSSSSHTRTLMRSDELWHSLDEAELCYKYWWSKNIKIGLSNSHYISRFNCHRWVPLYSQVEVFFPDGVEVAVDGLRSLLGLPNLNSYVRITGACFVLSLQTLSTHHWGKNIETFQQRPTQMSDKYHFYYYLCVF